MPTVRESIRLLREYFESNSRLTFEEVRVFVSDNKLVFGEKMTCEQIIKGFADCGIVIIDLEKREFRMPAIV